MLENATVVRAALDDYAALVEELTAVLGSVVDWRWAQRSMVDPTPYAGQVDMTAHPRWVRSERTWAAGTLEEGVRHGLDPQGKVVVLERADVPSRERELVGSPVSFVFRSPGQLDLVNAVERDGVLRGRELVRHIFDGDDVVHTWRIAGNIWHTEYAYRGGRCVTATTRKVVEAHRGEAARYYREHELTLFEATEEGQLTRVSRREIDREGVPSEESFLFVGGGSAATRGLASRVGDWARSTLGVAPR